MRLRPALTFAVLSLAAAALIGCGGTEGILGSNNSIELSASSTTVAYGQPVTISWVSRNTDIGFQNGFRDSNFADFRLPLPTTGSIVDRPALTTTYTMKVEKENGDVVTDSLTVTVPKGNKRFLVIAGTTSADGNSAATLLREITNATPVVSTTIPANGDGYDVLVLSEGGNFGTADQPKILTWLNAGKGVIVIGAAAQQIASGSVSAAWTSTSSISGWFGGVPEMRKETGSYSPEFVVNESQIGYSPTQRDWSFAFSVVGRNSSLSTAGEIDSIGAGAVAQSLSGPYITSFSYVFGTGRVYFIAGLQGPAVTPTAERAPIREFFLPGARWVSKE